MKTIPFWATTVAAALVVCLCGVPAKAQQGPPRPSGTSVAVIDLGEVFEQHQQLNTQLDSIKSQLGSFQAKVRQDKQQVQSLTDELRTLKPGTQTYTDKEKELANLQAALQVELRQEQRKLVDREAQARYQAYQDIQQHVQQFCKTYGIQLVIRFDRKVIDSSSAQEVLGALNRPIVYQNSLDITNHIIQSLGAGGPAHTTASNPQIPRRSN